MAIQLSDPKTRGPAPSPGSIMRDDKRPPLIISLRGTYVSGDGVGDAACEQDVEDIPQSAECCCCC